MDIRSKLKKIRPTGALIIRSWRMVYEFAGSWMMALGAITIVSALLPIANVYLTREVVDALASMQTPNATTAARLIALIAILVSVLLVAEAIDVLSDWIRLGYSEIVTDQIQSRLHKISIEADFKFFEIPHYHDQLYFATSGAEEEFTSTVDNVFALLRTAITLISMVIIIAGFSLWLPVALVFASVPTLLIIMIQSKRDHQLRKTLVPDERRASYYDWLIQASDSAAELRAYGLGKLFSDRYRSIRSSIRGRQLDVEKRQMLHRFGATVFGFLILGGALVFVILRAVAGQASIGDVAMFYRTMKYSQDVGLEFIQSLGALHKNSTFLNDFFRFLDTRHQSPLPKPSAKFPRNLATGIEFQNVSFTYPGSDHPVLHQLKLKIPAGKMTAILGPNGSGKSTILKLISRLYSEYDGSICIDGTNLLHFSITDLRQHLSVLFQEPMDYHLSLQENIAIGSEPTPEDSTKLAEAAMAADAASIIEKLPHKENTLLGKSLHEGEELSGGEWHRIATARSLFSNKTIILMDEPTSSLDPWAEIQWTKRMRDYLQARTFIVITHRVSVARLADHICVMNKGRLAESGTHEELIRRQGAYAKVSS